MFFPAPCLTSAFRVVLFGLTFQFASSLHSFGADTAGTGMPPRPLRPRQQNSALRSHQRQSATDGGRSRTNASVGPVAAQISRAHDARSAHAGLAPLQNLPSTASYQLLEPLLDTVKQEALNVAHASAARTANAGRAAVTAKEPVALGHPTKQSPRILAANLSRAISAVSRQLSELRGAFGNLTKQHQGPSASGRESYHRTEAPADALMGKTAPSDESEYNAWLMDRQQNLTQLIIMQADVIVNASLDLLAAQEEYNESLRVQEEAAATLYSAHNDTLAEEKLWWEQEGVMQLYRQYMNLNDSELVVVEDQVKEDAEAYADAQVELYDDTEELIQLREESETKNETLVLAEASYEVALANYSKTESQERNATERLQVAMGELSLRNKDFIEGHQRLLELRRKDEPPHEAPATENPMASLLFKEGHVSSAVVATIEHKHRKEALGQSVKPLDYDKVEAAIDDLFTDVENGETDGLDKNSSVPRAAVALSEADKASEPPEGLTRGVWSEKDDEKEEELTREVQKLATAEHDAGEHVMLLAKDLGVAQSRSDASFAELNAAHGQLVKAREESATASKSLSAAEQRHASTEVNKTHYEQALKDSQDELTEKAQAYTVAYEDYRVEQAKLNNMTLSWQLAVDAERIAELTVLSVNISANSNATAMKVATDRLDDELTKLNTLNDELVDVQCELYGVECVQEEGEDDDDSEDGTSTWVIVLSSFAILATCIGLILVISWFMHAQ